MLAQISPENTKKEGRQEFHFRDNLDVSDFMKLTQMQKWALDVNHKELEYVLIEKFPHMMKAGRKMKVRSGETDLKGFWYKLPFKGS